MKTLILGIGNPLLGDDTAGIITADRVKEKNLKNMDVEAAVPTLVEKIMEELI